MGPLGPLAVVDMERELPEESFRCLVRQEREALVGMLREVL